MPFESSVMSFLALHISTEWKKQRDVWTLEQKQAQFYIANIQRVSRPQSR